MQILNTEIRKSFKILELDLDASLDDVRKAFRTIVKIWHPDLYTGSPHLREMAEEKLKSVNAAYETVKAYLSSRKKKNIAPKSEARHTAKSIDRKKDNTPKYTSSSASKSFSGPFAWFHAQKPKWTFREYLKNGTYKNHSLNSSYYQTVPSPKVDGTCHEKDFKQVLKEVTAARLRSREADQTIIW